MMRPAAEICLKNFSPLRATSKKPMKQKPSEYQKLRYLKKENVPEGGSVFTITDFDEVNKSDKANQPDWRIRLTFDERWWFELYGGNLDTAIDLCSRLGLCIASFTTKEGEEKEFLKVVPAQEIKPKGKPSREPDSIPF
jgi:hypothetical protein